MNINQFAYIVALHEGKKKSVNIAQIKEILSIINLLTEGQFYEMIRGLDETSL